jgi:hypothetical protein
MKYFDNLIKSNDGSTSIVEQVIKSSAEGLSIDGDEFASICGVKSEQERMMLNEKLVKYAFEKIDQSYGIRMVRLYAPKRCIYIYLFLITTFYKLNDI